MATSFGMIRLFALFFTYIAYAYAQHLMDQISFGFRDPISPNLRGIPSWHISGSTTPQILRDKLILTPPAPGNVHAAAWSENTNKASIWNAEVHFRASGPERGSGKLQLWYTAAGHSFMGRSSINTVGTFDGLALVIDQYEGGAGTVRAFLNDGTVDYAKHQSIDSLAFAHCSFPYRNLGRMSKLSLKSESDKFVVLVDDKPCIDTSQVKLPPNYYFGLTAATSDVPDSFEIAKFVVYAPEGQEGIFIPPHKRNNAPPSSSPLENQQGQPSASGSGISAAELADLKSQISGFQQQLTALQASLAQIGGQMGERHTELTRMARVPYDQISAIDSRLRSVEGLVTQVKANVETKDYGAHLDEIRRSVRDNHAVLMTNLPESVSQIVTGAAPGIGLFVFWLVVIQAIVAVAYVLYKRRRANAPKKFL